MSVWIHELQDKVLALETKLAEIEAFVATLKEAKKQEDQAKSPFKRT